MAGENRVVLTIIVDKVLPSCEAILRFINHIAQDSNRTEAVTRGAVGILGYDQLHCFWHTNNQLVILLYRSALTSALSSTNLPYYDSSKIVAKAKALKLKKLPNGSAQSFKVKQF